MSHREGRGDECVRQRLRRRPARECHLREQEEELAPLRLQLCACK